MAQSAHDKSRTIRAVRRRTAPPSIQTQQDPAPEPELSNYELIERRSRELEIEHANGGAGTAQAPDAETPLLFSRPQGTAAGRQEPRGRSSKTHNPGT
jgi:hypothetical protein